MKLLSEYRGHVLLNMFKGMYYQHRNVKIFTGSEPADMHYLTLTHTEPCFPLQHKQHWN
jgi:hypothetical protein